MIDVLCPVLSRPQNVAPFCESLARNTSVDFSLIFIASDEDSEEIEAVKQSGARLLIDPLPMASRSQYPRKMNLGFRKTDREFVFLGADDIEFQSGWDTEALAVAGDDVGVTGLSDMANRHCIAGVWSTHPLVRRSYITVYGGSLDGPGTLISEAYDHNYSERELCHLAQHRGQWAFAPKARIKHKHPMKGAVEKDEVYAKGFQNFGADGTLFLRRAARYWEGAGLLPQENAVIRRMPRKSRS